ncbi:MAG: thiamine-phosphate kinase [Candidatus Methanogaster sp.]|uniref:Thiamine-phosphate kinase n=1 Tax=Candidatus Methanogaster sp. TaxID=3386292 RepID=A0AC61KZJ9_9EURY|nr:MAG: thiamine-phosphate kinase [ANME-2 cluster archaeon]
MTIYELGETAVVRAIIRSLDIEFEDCAVIDLADAEYLVATTDMFHRATDFPEEMSAWQIGWMTAAGTLSDIAAMGARPFGLLVSIGLPDLPPAFVESMIGGLSDCAHECGTAIIGGDTDSHQELTITGTALGCVRKDQILRRRGAQVGDLVCVTGHLGTAGAGMRALELGLATGDPVAVNKLFEPVPRIAEGIRLAESKAVTSMMDNSDGLSESLYQLAEVNGCGFTIHADSLPMLSGLDLGLGPDLDLALYTGGDFELLFTVAPERLVDARNACELTVIGEAISEGVFLEGDRTEEIERKGYRSLRCQDASSTDL